MIILWITLSILAFLILATLITSYVCFFRIFLKHKRRKKQIVSPVPEGEEYQPFADQITSWAEEARTLPYRALEIRSFDGLRLVGRYYEYAPDAPIELLLHGYRGSLERDLCAGIERCFSLGHSALLVDHRASGDSEGRVISFGINESRDCLAWVDYIIKNINADAKIILAGISMGAATVMISAAAELPENVIGGLADCGYTSAEEIIKKVMRDMHLPAKLLFPFTKLGARIFGGFDVDETSPIEAMQNARIPMLFIHGDTDDFVPYDMGRRNFEACRTRRSFVTVKGAGHALAYPVDKQKYISSMREFFNETK